MCSSDLIDLIGFGSSLWGDVNIENLVHVLENFACSEDIHAITAIPTASTFTIAGDVTLGFPTARTFDIFSSDNNDGSYTVLSSSYNVGLAETTITTITATLIVGGNLGSAGELGTPNRSLLYSPTTPIEGQLWYNQTQGQVFVFQLSGSPVGVWVRVGGITISSVMPTSPSEGDLWWDAAVYLPSASEFGRNLNIFIGGGFVRVVADYLPRDGSKVMTGGLHIETSDASTTANVNANELVLESATTVGMSLMSASTGFIYFGDVAGAFSGIIGYSHVGDTMTFATNSSTRMWRPISTI